MRWIHLVLVGFLCAACGSSPEPPPETPSAKKAPGKRASKRKAAKAKTATTIPERCPGKRKRCLPPGRWVEKLCANVYPDVALHMFGPDTPWVRFYMLHTAEPFNASGGMSLMGEKMTRGEEVIALRRRNARGGLQMADISGYDVLRWNGACASVHDGELTSVAPDEVRHARVQWRDLGLKLRLALEATPRIGDTYEARRKACKGISIGRVSAACEEYDNKLADEIVRYVRSGAELPAPQKAP